MTSLRQLDTVHKEIDDVKAEIRDSKQALAAAPDSNFLQQQLTQLRTKEEQLRTEAEQIREKDNILLRSQAVPGLHGWPWHHYALLTCAHVVCITTSFCTEAVVTCSDNCCLRKLLYCRWTKFTSAST